MEHYVIQQTERFSYDTVEIPLIQHALEASGISTYGRKFYDGELREYVWFGIPSTWDTISKFDSVYHNIRQRFPDAWVDIIHEGIFTLPEKVV